MWKKLWWAITIAVLSLALSSCDTSDPKDVSVSIQAPMTAKQGEKFVILAKVKNTASVSQKLVSLDVGDKYLDGVGIESTEPGSKSVDHVPIDNTMSYTYDLDLASGQEVVITLHAVALKPGDHNSTIDFCINTDHNFLTQPLRTVVQ